MRLLTISIRVAMINNLFSFCFLGLAKCIGKKDSAKFQVDAVEAVASLGEEKAKEKTWPLSVRRRRTRAKKKKRKSVENAVLLRFRAELHCTRHRAAAGDDLLLRRRQPRRRCTPTCGPRGESPPCQLGPRGLRPTHQARGGGGAHRAA